ncbi:MAG: hypothetical protein CMJ32_02620 [Phycisphaerae bacterium]|nr:hypothetical protein [Phycisphaerae bacterium]
MNTSSHIDRRVHDRIDINRPTKVHHKRLDRYVAGTTSNLSAGGACIEIETQVPFEPGTRIHVGVAMKRRDSLLFADEMIPATVLRSLSCEGRTNIAIRFDSVLESMTGPQLQLAA